MYVLLFAACLLGDPQSDSLPGALPLEEGIDHAARMVDSIDAWLMDRIAESPGRRERLWQRGHRTEAEDAAFLAAQRERLKRFFGVVDPRVADTAPRSSAQIDGSSAIGMGDGVEVLGVRWEALDGVHGEGLLIQPRGAEPAAEVIVVPDADQSPETALGFEPGVSLAELTQQLVGARCRVIVVALVDRTDEFSVVAENRATNLPHRELVYRQAYELGRHIVGYEVQKVLALVDWLSSRSDRPIGVFGYSEGGLVALVAAACDERIDAAAVAGYFGQRERVWNEPIYRNTWRRLAEFGDAEIAALIVPRALIVETSAPIPVDGPPPPCDDRRGAAPGRIDSPRNPQAEFASAVRYARPRGCETSLELVEAGENGVGSSARALLRRLAPGATVGVAKPLWTTKKRLAAAIRERQRRQVDELVEFTQALLARSEGVRRAFWSKADSSSLDRWRDTTTHYRDYLRHEVIGHIDRALADPRPRARPMYDEPAFRGYEVVIDVFDGVFAQGILLVPKDLRPGERRPVVVCQHGLEGRPTDVADPRLDHPAYHRFACRLAERGFVTYAPQNPYIGGDRFRVLQRKANPLGLSLFSFIVKQHEQTVAWLGTLPFVDREKIAFYGLSYGGKTAMRVPPLVDGYCLSICSADFNEWIWKNASAASPYSYLATGEYEMPEFDLGNTFNYAELAGLIAPRAFMVERGHDDGVAPDEQVAYEYAKVRRLYARLGIPGRTRIEFFDGPHTIHGVGTFEFLEQQLGKPRSGR